MWAHTVRRLFNADIAYDDATVDLTKLAGTQFVGRNKAIAVMLIVNPALIFGSQWSNSAEL